MIYIVLVAVIGMVLFMVMQRRKQQHQSVEKDALQLAWEKKDYDAYLTLLKEKIDSSKNKKEKNILATLQMDVFILKKDWQKMDALKRNVKSSELPKNIRVTFLAKYIIGLCLSDRPQAALAWMEKEKPILTEAEANGTYSLYTDTLKALKTFYHKQYGESKELFESLAAKEIPGDLYAPLFADYLNRIAEAEEESANLIEEAIEE